MHRLRSLLKHPQGSVHEKYIDGFINEDTGLLDSTIADILEHLFTHYGIVTGEQVKAEEHEVLRTSFTPSDPLVTIWSPLEKLKKFATYAKNPYTDIQIIDFALQLIRNTRDFEQGLLDWNKKRRVIEHGITLIFFKDAQQGLKELRGPSMLQAGFAHENYLAQEIRQEIKHSNTELANMLTAYEVKEEFPTTTATGSLSEQIVQIQLLKTHSYLKPSKKCKIK